MMWVSNNYWYESSRSSELSNRHLKKEIVLHPICLLDVLVEIMVSVGSELVDIANYRQCLTAGWSAAVTEFMLKCTCVTMVFTIAICLGIHTPVWYVEELTSNAFRHLVSSNDQIPNLFGFFSSNCAAKYILWKPMVQVVVSVNDKRRYFVRDGYACQYFSLYSCLNRVNEMKRVITASLISDSYTRGNFTLKKCYK